MPEQFSRLERVPHKDEVSGSIPLFGTNRSVGRAFNQNGTNPKGQSRMGENNEKAAKGLDF